jgi:hypothetical protein
LRAPPGACCSAAWAARSCCRRRVSPRAPRARWACKGALGFACVCWILGAEGIAPRGEGLWTGGGGVGTAPRAAAGASPRNPLPLAPPPGVQALAQHVSRFSLQPAPSPAHDDAREALSAALQCCHALMSRGGMEPLLAAPEFLRHLAASLAADVGLTGADEARLALEMMTKALLYSSDAYALTLQALLGLPLRRPRRPRWGAKRGGGGGEGRPAEGPVLWEGVRLAACATVPKGRGGSKAFRGAWRACQALATCALAAWGADSCEEASSAHRPPPLLALPSQAPDPAREAAAAPARPLGRRARRRFDGAGIEGAQRCRGRALGGRGHPQRVSAAGAAAGFTAEAAAAAEGAAAEGAAGEAAAAAAGAADHQRPRAASRRRRRGALAARRRQAAAAGRAAAAAAARGRRRRNGRRRRRRRRRGRAADAALAGG